MNPMHRGPLIAVAATLLALAFAPAAQAQTVAFPRVKGPKPAGRGPTAEGVTAELTEAGIEVVRGQDLRDAASELGTTVYDPDVALSVGCDYLITVRLSGKKGRFKAVGTLLRVEDGEVLQTVQRKYASKKRATRTGRTLGRELLEALLEDVGDEGEPAPEMVIEPIDEPPEPPAAPEKRSTDIKVDRADAGLFAPSNRRSSREGYASTAEEWEKRTLRFGLSAGSRAFGSYVVRVGNVATTLSYNLDPVFAAAANVAFIVPSTALEVQAQFLFMPVTFGVATIPETNPSNPGGQLFGAGGNAGWRFDLLSNLRLTPFVGFDYSSTLVELQEPDTIVNEFSTIALGGGLRVTADAFDTVAFELQGDAGWILDFTEGQVTTGDPQDGFRITSRLRVRWWILAPVGLELMGRYEYRRIGLSGPSTRTEFVEDPTIADASITIEGVDVMAGVVVAF